MLIFSVRLVSINNLIPIQTLVSSRSFIKIPILIISIALFLFISISISIGLYFKDQSWELKKKKTCFNFFSVSQDYRCFLQSRYLLWTAALWRKFSCLGLQLSVWIADDIVQMIRIKRVMSQFQEVLSLYKVLVWVDNSYTYLGKCRTLLWPKTYIDV